MEGLRHRVTNYRIRRIERSTKIYIHIFITWITLARGAQAEPATCWGLILCQVGITRYSAYNLVWIFALHANSELRQMSQRLLDESYQNHIISPATCERDEFHYISLCTLVEAKKSFQSAFTLCPTQYLCSSVQSICMGQIIWYTWKDGTHNDHVLHGSTLPQQFDIEQA
jgi:hypothetical protein